MTGETFTLQVGDQTLTAEARAINLIFQPARAELGPPVRYPGRVPLDNEAVVYHAERLGQHQLHAEFAAAWRAFMDNTTDSATVEPLVPTVEQVRSWGPAARYLLGLIDLSLKLQDLRVPFVWVRPEAGMHPGWQVALADLVLWFAARAGLLGGE